MSRVPDFIGIGVAKAATSWIHYILSQHPNICVGTRKELHFFDRDFNFKKGIQYYLSFFDICAEDKLIGEFTPSYLTTPKTAERMHEFFPNIKLIVCLRNPIERAYSHYRYIIERKLTLSIYKSFEALIKSDKKFLERGLYFKHLKKFFDIFPRRNIKVIFFEDIISKPLDSIREIYSFLELSDQEFIPQNYSEAKLKSGSSITKYKIPLISPILFKIAVELRKMKFFRDPSKRTLMRKFLNNIIRKNYKIEFKENIEVLKIPPMEESSRKTLYDFYKGDIKKLEGLLNKDLSHWK